jgi:hypothetical protein
MAGSTFSSEQVRPDNEQKMLESELVRQNSKQNISCTKCKGGRVARMTGWTLSRGD